MIPGTVPALNPRSPISAAIVGTGFIGPVHGEALRRPGVTGRGALGATPEQARAASP